MIWWSLKIKEYPENNNSWSFLLKINQFCFVLKPYKGCSLKKCGTRTGGGNFSTFEAFPYRINKIFDPVLGAFSSLDPSPAQSFKILGSISLPIANGKNEEVLDLERAQKLQGGNQLLTKSMAQLWPHFESWWLFEPTGGSPDVVHLIINASEVSG